MDLSVILEACNRTVLKLHHADFKYTEGILSHWNEQNVRTLQGVEQSDLHYAQTKEQKKRRNLPHPVNNHRAINSKISSNGMSAAKNYRN